MGWLLPVRERAWVGPVRVWVQPREPRPLHVPVRARVGLEVQDKGAVGRQEGRVRRDVLRLPARPEEGLGSRAQPRARGQAPRVVLREHPDDREAPNPAAGTRQQPANDRGAPAFLPPPQPWRGPHRPPTETHEHEQPEDGVHAGREDGEVHAPHATHLHANPTPNLLLNRNG